MAATTPNPHHLSRQLRHNAQFQEQHAMSRKQIRIRHHAFALVNEFFIELIAQNPNQPIDTYAWWALEYPNEVMGGILSDILLWLVFYRLTGTQGLNSVFSTSIPYMYYQVKARYVQLQNEPPYSKNKLCARSEAFMRACKFVVDVCTGKYANKGKINAVCPQDAHRVASCTEKFGKGARFIAWLYTTLDLGPRAASFIRTTRHFNSSSVFSK